MYSRSRYHSNQTQKFPYTNARQYRPEWRAQKNESESAPATSRPQEIRLPPMYRGNAFPTFEEPPRFDFHDSRPDDPPRTQASGTAHGLGDTARNLLLPHEAVQADAAWKIEPETALGDGQFAPRFPLYEEADDRESPYYPQRPRRPATQTNQHPIGNGAARTQPSGFSALTQELLHGVESLPALLGNLSEEEVLLGTLIVLLLTEGKDDLMVLLLLFLLLS